MKIKTNILKALLNKAAKGASFDKKLPITFMMELSVDDGRLKLTTHDGTNYLEVSTADFDGEDFTSVTVNLDGLHKLVANTTAGEITLNVKDGKYLEFKGNGVYKLELPIDEEGELVEFPMPEFTPTVKDAVKRSEIKAVETYNKLALRKMAGYEELRNYYSTQSRTVTSNGDLIVTVPVSIIGPVEEGVLYSSTVELLSLIEDEDIAVALDAQSNQIVFVTESVIIMSRLYTDGQFPIAAVDAFLADTKLNSSCQLPRLELISLLTRLSLFGNNILNVLFDKAGITFTTEKGEATETMCYQGSTKHKKIAVKVNAENFKTMLKGLNTDLVKLDYGAPNAFRIDATPATILFSLECDDDAAVPEEEPEVHEVGEGTIVVDQMPVSEPEPVVAETKVAGKEEVVVVVPEKPARKPRKTKAQKAAEAQAEAALK